MDLTRHSKGSPFERHGDLLLLAVWCFGAVIKIFIYAFVVLIVLRLASIKAPVHSTASGLSGIQLALALAIAGALFTAERLMRRLRDKQSFRLSHGSEGAIISTADRKRS